MTIDQIRSAGIAINKWDNLQNVCKSILFSNEGYMYIAPRTAQYYFEESSNLVFVRYIKAPLSKTNFDGAVEVNLIEGNSVKRYYGKLQAGGAKDSGIGTYHNVFDIGAITAILS